ncbi:unnamed protein product [Arctogadus glacialis]
MTPEAEKEVDVQSENKHSHMKDDQSDMEAHMLHRVVKAAAGRPAVPSLPGAAGVQGSRVRASPAQSHSATQPAIWALAPWPAAWEQEIKTGRRSPREHDIRLWERVESHHPRRSDLQQQDNFREQSLDLSEKDWHESEVKKADSRLHLYRQHSLVRGGCGYSRQDVYGVYS